MKGIYTITNLINNKTYVGSSIHIKSRWNTHVRQLNKNKHHNIHLQSAWNKYGKSNFEFNVVEKVHNSEDLCSRENDWINLLESFDSSKGYNKGASIRGGEVSKEHVNNLKNIAKNLGITKSCIVTNLKGVVLDRFETYSDAADRYKTTQQTISKLIKGKQKKLYGKYFVFKDVESINIQSKIKKTRIVKNHKKVEMYTLTGSFIRLFNSAIEASTITGIKESSIRSCTSYKQNQVNGYMFFNEGGFRPYLPKIGGKPTKKIYQYTMNKVLIAEHVSAGAAARSINSSSKRIYECISGKRKSHKGFIWSRELLPKNLELSNQQHTLALWTLSTE